MFTSEHDKRPYEALQTKNFSQAFNDLKVLS